MSHIEGGTASAPVDIPVNVSTSLDVSPGSTEAVGPTLDQRPGGELSATQPSRFAPSVRLEQTTGVTASPVAEKREEPNEKATETPPDLHESVRTDNSIVPPREEVQRIYQEAGVGTDGTKDLGNGNVRIVEFSVSAEDGHQDVEQINEGDKGQKVEGIADGEEQQAERDMQRGKDTSVSSEVVAEPVEAEKPGAEDPDKELHLDTVSDDVVPARKENEDPSGTLADDDIAPTETPADQAQVKALEDPEGQEAIVSDGEVVVSEETDTAREDIVAENEQTAITTDTTVEPEMVVTESPAPEAEIVAVEVVEPGDPTDRLAVQEASDEPEVIAATENTNKDIELAQDTGADVAVEAQTPKDDQVEVLEDASGVEEGPEHTDEAVVVIFAGPAGLKKTGDFLTVSDVTSKEEEVESPTVADSVKGLVKASPSEKAAAVGLLASLPPDFLGNFTYEQRIPLTIALGVSAANTILGEVTSRIDRSRERRGLEARFKRERVSGVNSDGEVTIEERPYGSGGIYITLPGEHTPLPQNNPKAAAAGIPGPDSIRLRDVPGYWKENVRIPSVPSVPELPFLPSFGKPLEEKPGRFPLDEHGRAEIVARFREVDSRKSGRERNGATPEALTREAFISAAVGGVNAVLLKQGMPEIPAGATGAVSTIYGVRKGWKAFQENQEGKRSDFGAGKYNHHVYKDNEIVGAQRTAEGVALVAADATIGVFDGAQTLFYLGEAAVLATKAGRLTRDNITHTGLRRDISRDDARRAEVHARATTLTTRRHRLDPESETGRAILNGGSTRHSGLTKEQRQAIKAAQGDQAVIAGILEAARTSLSNKLKTLEDQAGYVPGQDPPKGYFGKDKGKWFIAE